MIPINPNENWAPTTPSISQALASLERFEEAQANFSKAVAAYVKKEKARVQSDER